MEFVVANKVTHVVNCAGKEVPNHWEAIGVAYLTFNWLDEEHQVIFGNNLGRFDERGQPIKPEED